MIEKDLKQMRKTMAMVALALSSLPLAANAQNVEVGGKLAERWCMGCHVVGVAPRGVATDGVPSFPVIAARQTTTVESLDRYLSTAHTSMPDFSLSRSERSALVNYILSLR